MSVHLYTPFTELIITLYLYLLNCKAHIHRFGPEGNHDGFDAKNTPSHNL